MTPRFVPTSNYSLAGLHMRSEVPLPSSLLWDAPPSEAAEISIRYGDVPLSLQGATAFPEAQYDGKDLLVNIPEAARFLVREGKEVLVDPAPSAAEGDVSAFLLGTVFGALCHQRGIVPFHSSAIDVSGGCIVFTGASGAGKSTLAAALATRGHRVVSDDVCFLRRIARGEILVWPGIARIRLWEDALRALGYDASTIQREFRGLNKFVLETDPPESPREPRRLLRVYQLEPAPTGKPPLIEGLQGAPTIELLMPNVYRLTLAEYMGVKPAIFALCADIARRVPVFRFQRQIGFDALPGALDCLEAHFADVL